MDVINYDKYFKSRQVDVLGLDEFFFSLNFKFDTKEK